MKKLVVQSARNVTIDRLADVLMRQRNKILVHS